MLSAVVLPSLLIAAAVGAQPAKGGSTTGTSAGSGAAAGSAAAPAGAGSASPTGTPASSTTAGAGSAAAPAPDLAAVKPEDMPTSVRMRRLEQKTQALKERAWQLKARLEMLKEQTLGGGVGAQAMIGHLDDMGASFRLTKLIYSLDGTQVFARTDETADSLYKTKTFDVFAGPIAPGNHNLQIVAQYRGHGYGVFEYLTKFTFTARGQASFTTGEGKISKVECKGYEKGGAATPMEKRPAIECKIAELSPEKPAENTAPTNPGATPLPPPAAGSATAPAPAPAPGK
ncbi:MAG: hypothetical protein HOV81_35205 [Kofleriaceae bacterium]|nr:hypothetical protein [Kofleriaceae bacterium]